MTSDARWTTSGGGGTPTFWMLGERRLDVGNLKDALIHSGRWHARNAIRLFVSYDADELLLASISAGTAVELLAKAYLIDKNPAMLADRGHRDTIFLLGGHYEACDAGPMSMRTIGGADALKLVRCFIRTLPVMQSEPVVLQVRNAALHAGISSPSDLRKAATEMARLAEILLPGLGLERERFWGPHSIKAVDALIDDARTERAQAVAAKVGAASRRVRLLLAGLTGAKQDELLRTLSSRETSTFLDQNERHKCPVCDQQGWLACVIEQVEFSGEEFSTPVALPVEFGCPVCELHLEYEELEEFDFPRQFFTYDPDAEDWEPDEDYFRDR